MNVLKLKKKLRDCGAKQISDQGPHETWVSVKGSKFAVPRHKEINEYTAKAILKQALK